MKYCGDQFCGEISRGPIFSISSPHPPYKGASAEHVFPRGCVRVRAPRGALRKIFRARNLFWIWVLVFFAESSRVPCPPINTSTANPEVLYVTVAHKCFLSFFFSFWWPSQGFRDRTERERERGGGIPPIMFPARLCRSVLSYA